MMAILINTLTNCSLTNYSLRKKKLKQKKDLRNSFFFPRYFQFWYQNITKSGWFSFFFNHDADPDPDPKHCLKGHSTNFGSIHKP